MIDSHDESTCASNPVGLLISRSNAGRIVRVKLLRFVTYNAVEFRPGPNLNMIIGPNGTGKSSIVCAIALGLGWKPSVLGRAKDVASYVKHGAEDAVIELELETKDEAEPNVVLERRIFTRDNRSEWKLNGSRATAVEVQAQVNAFNINVGNLCCFLPQDKVADFARMSPAELLKETQKAAGAERMTDWHSRLIELGREQREVGGKLDKERDEVNNLEERNNILQKDVRRAEERQKIEDDIALLELQIPYARYGKAKEIYDDRKIVRNQRKKEFEDLRKKAAPLDQRLRDMEQTNAEMLRDIKAKQQRIAKDAPAISKLHKSLEEQESESTKLSDALNSVRKREGEAKKQIATLSRKVAELEKDVENEPPRPNTSEIDARIRAIKDSLRSMKSDEVEQGVASDEISGEVNRLDQETDQMRARLARLDNVKNARLELLKSADSHAYQAVKWLREHPERFERPVNEPVMLDLSVKDQRFAKAIETSIPFASMKTFVCETRKDYDTLTSELNDKMGLRLNVAEIGEHETLASFRKPMEQAELNQMGFDHFLIDCIEAPEGIKRFLCSAHNLHLIPLAIREDGVDVEALERTAKFKRYIVGSNVSTITISNYGSRLPQVLTRPLKPARTLVNSIDQSLKNSLETRLHQIGTRKIELEDKIKGLKRDEVTLHKRMETLRRQQLELEQEKGAAQRPRSKWEKDVISLNSTREALAHERSKPSAAEQSRKLTADLAKVNAASREVITKIMGLMEKQVQMRSEMDMATLRQLQYQEKVNGLAALRMEQEEQFQEAQQAQDDAAREFTRAKEEAMQLYKQAQAFMESVPSAVREAFASANENVQQTLEQLETKLMEEQDKLNLMIEVRPGVMDEYNQRRRKIEEINTVIQKLAKDKEKIDAKVQSLESRWVAALNELVDNVSQRFSRAFQSIGNAGEVRVARHEDYDKWGIEIMVKFRDNEQLQLLTASRQSGGERSISTITYLLSLTEMSRSPFSLVDEINQGMDQKYERQVHNHMVNVTCKEDAGQYFLITPKLLPQLAYHERMKILVINNGEWLPDTGFNFGHYIDKRKALTGASNGRLAATQA